MLVENTALCQGEYSVSWTRTPAPPRVRKKPCPQGSSSAGVAGVKAERKEGLRLLLSPPFRRFQEPDSPESPRKGQSRAELPPFALHRLWGSTGPAPPHTHAPGVCGARHGEPLEDHDEPLEDLCAGRWRHSWSKYPIHYHDRGKCLSRIPGRSKGRGDTQSLCWEPDNREIYRGAGRHKQGCAQQDLGHPAASLKEAGPLTLVVVKTMMCWTSRQVRHGRTCSISAIIPAARGAAADVPVWPSVQPVPFCKSQSVVTFRGRGEMPPVRPLFATLGWLA